MIAIHLSKNQRYREAQAWFHYVFDPTDDSRGDTPDRFWKVRPFQSTHVELVTDILTNLSTGQDPQLRQDTINCIGPGRTPRSARTWSPDTGRRLTCSRP